MLGSILAGAATGTLLRFTGLRNALNLAALLYLLGSLFCALAINMPSALAGRLVQGIGGGYLVALAFVAIRKWFDPDIMPKVFALTSAIWSASTFAGPLVGRSFATFGNWRMAYIAAALQAVVFIAIVLLVAPKDKMSHPTERP